MQSEIFEHVDTAADTGSTSEATDSMARTLAYVGIGVGAFGSLLALGMSIGMCFMWDKMSGNQPRSRSFRVIYHSLHKLHKHILITGSSVPSVCFLGIVLHV